MPSLETPLSPAKELLRLDMKARRAALGEAERVRAASQLGEVLFQWLETRSERVLAVYLAQPLELSLDSLIVRLLREGYTIAAPRVDLASREMTFWRLFHLEEVEIGPWNLRQPPRQQQIAEIPLLLAPGLAFDKLGGRLGSGGGWYDRILDRVPTAVGLGFDCQIVPRVPLDAHDRRVQFIGSEARWIKSP